MSSDRGHGQEVSYISYTDQALLLARRSAGHEPVVQVLWIYDRAVDEAGLHRLHSELSRGLLGRRIARSPLPFGRHRWTSEPVIAAPLDISSGTVPRDRLWAWADRQVDLPLDPEDGPAWRLSATALDDGGWAVSLVVSHCIADGGATGIALVAAASRRSALPDEGPAQPESRGAMLRRDCRRLWSDLPEIGGALRAGVAGARTARRDPGRAVPQVVAQSHSADDLVSMPTVSVVLDQSAWEARAAALHGNSLSLVAGVAARLGVLAGRQRDGVVSLMVPVSGRGGQAAEGGNVVSVARVAVAADGLARDLSPARTALRTAIAAAREVPDPMVHLLPLVPFVPGALYARLADRVLGFNRDLPVSCSSMGDLDPLIACADGTPSDYLLLRGVDRRVTAGSLARRGGVITLVSGTINGRFSLNVVGWQAGSLTTRDELHRLVSAVLGEFGISGTVI